MTTIRKFAFDREFSADGAVLRESAVTPKKITPEESEALCAQAYERGKQDAYAAAEREAAAALKELAGAAQATLSKLDHEAQAMRAEAARIALSSARKIADSALDAYGPERAVKAVEAAMETLRHQPRLIVKVSEHDAETLRPRIEAACQALSYGGAVIVRPDADYKTGAVSVDWSGGMVLSDPQEVAERLHLLIEQALAADAPN